jgi:hypothetical protein
MFHSSAILGILEKLMRIFEDPYWWTVALSSVVQLTMFGRWIYRRIRNDEMMRAFAEDMAKIICRTPTRCWREFATGRESTGPIARKSTGLICSNRATENKCLTSLDV